LHRLLQETELKVIHGESIAACLSINGAEGQRAENDLDK
jgi:ABC-type Na+ efflux pump permease subunit